MAHSSTTAHNAGPNGGANDASSTSSNPNRCPKHVNNGAKDGGVDEAISIKTMNSSEAFSSSEALAETLAMLAWCLLTLTDVPRDANSKAKNNTSATVIKACMQVTNSSSKDAKTMLTTQPVSL